MWKKAPRYVVLIGDASQDPRNYLGLGANDLIPTRIVNAATMEAASDDALADFDNDGIAEIAIGRLPVRTTQEAATVTRKIVDYERGQAVEGTVIVADRNDGFDFEGASQAVAGLLPNGEARQEIFRSRMTDSSARAAIVAAINRGPRVVNYTGHGSLGLWRGNLLTNSDAAQTDESAVAVGGDGDDVFERAVQRFVQRQSGRSVVESRRRWGSGRVGVVSLDDGRTIKR